MKKTKWKVGRAGRKKIKKWKKKWNLSWSCQAAVKQTAVALLRFKGLTCWNKIRT